MKYLMTVHREDGLVVTEAKDVKWNGVSSYVAAWSRQMVSNAKVGEDVWDDTYYIQIHVVQ